MLKVSENPHKTLLINKQADRRTSVKTAPSPALAKTISIRSLNNEYDKQQFFIKLLVIIGDDNHTNILQTAATDCLKLA